MTYYLCTLTYENGLNDEHLSKAKLYFKSLSWCIACHETGDSGSNDHIHAIIKYDKAGNLLRRIILKEVYGKNRNDDVDPHMLRVEKCKDIAASIRYVSKNVEKDYFIKVGVPIKWLQDQLVVAHVNKRWYTKWKHVPVNQAPGCIIDYVKTHNVRLVDKSDFVNCIHAIAKYVDTSKWIKSAKWIYAQTMLMHTDDNTMDKLWENELHFI